MPSRLSSRLRPSLWQPTHVWLFSAGRQTLVYYVYRTRNPNGLQIDVLLVTDLIDAWNQYAQSNCICLTHPNKVSCSLTAEITSVGTQPASRWANDKRALIGPSRAWHNSRFSSTTDFRFPSGHVCAFDVYWFVTHIRIFLGMFATDPVVRWAYT